ncbi:hypothetical protein [Actinophytocola sp.]
MHVKEAERRLTDLVPLAGAGSTPRLSTVDGTVSRRAAGRPRHPASVR